MTAPATAEEIRDVNTRYHDGAATGYDAKWGIDFGEIGQAQVLGKLSKLIRGPLGPFPEALEIGAGTGYFSLNLARAGVIGHATCTDISPGMLAAQQLVELAQDLGLADLPEVDAPLGVVAGSRAVVVTRVDVADLLGGGGSRHRARECSLARS